MADYKRMVSYMYQYENGVKKKNVGYARIETKSGQCKITLHMQLPGQLDSIFPTYLINRKNKEPELIYLGDSLLRNQVLESRLTAGASNIMDSGCDFTDVGGILLFLNEDIFFATEWDDKPIIAEDIKLAMKPKPKKIDKEPAGEDKKAGAGIQEKLQSVLKEDMVPVYKLPRGWKTVERLQNSEDNSSMDSVRNNSVNNDNINTEVVQRSEKSSNTDTGPVKKEYDTEGTRLVGHMEERRGDTFSEEEVKGDEKEACKEDGEEDIGEKEFANKTIQYEEFLREGISQDSINTEENRAEESKADEFSAEEQKTEEYKKNFRPEEYRSEEFRPEEFKPEELTRIELKPEEKKTQENIEHTSEEAKPEEMISRENVKQKKIIGEDMKREEQDKEESEDKYEEAEDKGMEHCSEEDSKTEITEEKEMQEHAVAARFFENYQRMYPFEDNEIIHCVKIEPKDIGFLPKEVWGLSNNSFLLHSYYSYHHLIFAKMKDRFGIRYIIGIPGTFHNKEHFMARMFGFENFKSAAKRELRQGDFGYWYLPVSLR